MAKPPSTGSAAFDWEKCIFCQTCIRGEKTSCPSLSKRTDVGIGYKTVADVIDGFLQLNRLLDSLKPFVCWYNDGDGIHETFVQRRAVWHITCKQRLVHATKLDRLRVCATDSEQSTHDEPAVQVDESDGTCPTVPRCTRSAKPSSCKESVCFFCDVGGCDLRQVQTFAVDEKVRRCADVLGDSMLLGKLAKGDMIALEAKYHPSCLLNLYYRTGRQEKEQQMEYSMAPYECESEALALAEVISHIEDNKVQGTAPTVFKLSDIRNCTLLTLLNTGLPKLRK